MLYIFFGFHCYISVFRKHNAKMKLDSVNKVGHKSDYGSQSNNSIRTLGAYQFSVLSPIWKLPLCCLASKQIGFEKVQKIWNAARNTISPIQFFSSAIIGAHSLPFSVPPVEVLTWNSEANCFHLHAPGMQIFRRAFYYTAAARRPLEHKCTLPYGFTSAR